MSKRPRPADLRQPDLFGAPDAGRATGSDPLPPAAAAESEPAAAAPGEAVTWPAGIGPSGAEPVGTSPAGVEPAGAGAGPDRAAPAVSLADAAPVDGAARPAARPGFRRVDPLGVRAADPPDSYLYCVVTREVADRMLRDGLPDEDPPALVERGAVPRRLAAAAADLGWTDEQPGAIAVLRVRRGEVEQAGAPPQGVRLRRAG